MQINKFEAIKLINSLKSGVTYDALADNIMVGREPLIKEIERQLASVESGGSSYKIITGDYGSGKTFILNKIRKVALESEMLVAHLEIDSTFKFYNLEHLYYNIMHNLYIKSSGETKTSFEDLFERWLSKLNCLDHREKAQNEIMQVVETISKHNSTFGRAFLSYIKARIANDTESKTAIESWLTGEKNVPHHLKRKFDMIGNVTKLNALDFLRAFVKLIVLLGYKGFVILVDEFDLIIDDRSDLREKSYYNTKYIIDSLGNNNMDHIMWLFCGTTRLIKDKEKGFASAEGLFQRIGEPIIDNRRNFIDYRQPVIQIDSIKYDDFSLLSEKIVQIYMIAFNIAFKISSDAIMNWALLTLVKEGKNISSINSRLFIKKILEIMDVIEQNPKNHIFRSELISSMSNGKLQFKTRLGTHIMKEKTL